MEQTNLTTLEKDILNAIMVIDADNGDGEYGVWNQDFLMGVSFEELVEEVGLKDNTIKGVLGSLTKKDILNVEEDDGYTLYFASQNPYPIS